MALPSGELIGSLGRRYILKQLIQERPRLGRVWLATSGQEKFVLKDIPEAIFSSFNEDIRPRLHESPYLRLPCDTIPNKRTFAYRYMDDDLLSLVRKQVSVQTRKQVLKAGLRGIADLHSHDVVHLDIKPENIMVNYSGTGPETTIEQVRVIDLENAAYLPKGRCIKGMLAGNDNWRSPEAHLKGELNKPSDIFSFAAVCIYAMLRKVIFGADEDLRKHEAQGAFPYVIRLQRQVSYFGDRKGLNGLITHIGDDYMHCKVLGFLWDDRVADYHPYKPFSQWSNDMDDPEFEDMILKMTSLDPQKRVTAHEALEHPWFSHP
ncbi:serine/threonine protein kinase [Nannizzia gypsea CBS 118893]|uniref:Serine/threonine protein kinase n=1 Tax=Arthroderma gypseum (strain ATCC MYA-4604 / CBS 118893) TaxID=535722 RepID=E4V549_ARTGP|nr:serine/threonine protein kinase [Nannizzia gypsea CBS 118893]EFR05123.1 serine/threonine protein kinase [Nannizzia gypsea CBS 118893]